MADDRPFQHCTGSAVLGMIYLQRKNAAAQEVNVPSCISCYLGVTELPCSVST